MPPAFLLRLSVRAEQSMGRRDEELSVQERGVVFKYSFSGQELNILLIFDNIIVWMTGRFPESHSD